jgi:hypothetical protein
LTYVLEGENSIFKIDSKFKTIINKRLALKSK